MPTPRSRQAKRPRRQKRQQPTTRRLIQAGDLLKMTFVGDPQVSPDGSQIVFVRKHINSKNEYVRNLWMVPADGKAKPRQFTAGERDGSPRWSPDGSRIAFVGGRTRECPQVYVISAGGGEATPLTSLPEGKIGAMRWSPDGKTIGISFRPSDPEWTEEAKKNREKAGLSDPPRVLDHWWYRLDGDGYFNGQRYALYLVDAQTGGHRVIYSKDTLGSFSFDFSPDRRQIVISTNRDRRAGLRAWNDDLLFLTIGSGKIDLARDLPRGAKSCVRWSPDGRYVAYAGREGPDGLYSTQNLECWVYDTRSGKARSLTWKTNYCLLAPPITDTAEVAFEPNLQWHPNSRSILLGIGWQGQGHIASVDVASGRTRLLTRGVADRAMGNVSRDGKAVALISAMPTQPPEVHVARLKGSSASTRPLTDFNREWLDGLRLAQVTEHWVKTADGNEVHTWVMKPPGAKASRRYPAILEVHGGPHAQYGVGFFFEFQLLAAQGYVVVYSNPRGSKGYGRDHCHAIHGHWGTADWTDVLAVTNWMQRQPFLNPKRMGIMGGSYGGYMTNWAIGHTNAFKAAITDRCVSNMHSMQGTSDFLEPPDLYFPGNTWSKPEALWEQSPLKYFGNVRTPTLIIHSEGDLRCNVEQAEQIYAVLNLRGIPCRFVRYPRSTSHGMSRGGPPDLRLHRLNQIVQWWKKHLG